VSTKPWSSTAEKRVSRTVRVSDPFWGTIARAGTVTRAADRA